MGRPTADLSKTLEGALPRKSASPWTAVRPLGFWPQSFPTPVGFTSCTGFTEGFKKHRYGTRRVNV